MRVVERLPPRTLALLFGVLTWVAESRDARADCASYCAEVNAACTGANKQYDGPDPNAQCLATCGHLPPGTDGDMSGNSLACREYWAAQAAADPANECPKAGPAGAAVCGLPQCDVFCSLSQAICSGADEVYSDAYGCFEDCVSFYQPNHPFFADQADATDSFACRMYQLVRAAEDSNSCPAHAGMNADIANSTVCVEPIEPGTGGGGGGGGSGGAGGDVAGAGGNGTGGGLGGGGGEPSSASGFTPPQKKEDDGGCAVRSFQDPAASDWVWWLALALPFVRRRPR